MTPAEEAVLRELPCLVCDQHRHAERVRAVLGAYYLRALAGDKTAPPPLDVALKRCCKNAQAGVTFTGILPTQLIVESCPSTSSGNKP